MLPSDMICIPPSRTRRNLHGLGANGEVRPATCPDLVMRAAQAVGLRRWLVAATVAHLIAGAFVPVSALRHVRTEHPAVQTRW